MGTYGWVTWHDIFHVLDIICCVVILFPIMWSVARLQDAAAVDDVGIRYFCQFLKF